MCSSGQSALTKARADQDSATATCRHVLTNFHFGRSRVFSLDEHDARRNLGQPPCNPWLEKRRLQIASGEIYDAVSVVAFGDRKDLAIIKVAESDLPVIGLGNSNDVKSGEPVVAIGSPRGLQGTVTAW
ncbi:MAG: trypsin-like peptidase domain-containing protein [Acidobacteria bacterium]|nr:trypsin-like peptidase domain-containing protein [Acidobacteriota bacterium]